MATDANAKNQQGKLSDDDIEYFLRDVEQRGLDPFHMKAKLQVWEKNKNKPNFYGESGSNRRELFSRFLSNTIRRKGKGWKDYVDLLESKEIDMSELMEQKYEEELARNGGPNDELWMMLVLLRLLYLNLLMKKKLHSTLLLFLIQILILAWMNL